MTINGQPTLQGQTPRYRCDFRDRRSHRRPFCRGRSCRRHQLSRSEECGLIALWCRRQRSMSPEPGAAPRTAPARSWSRSLVLKLSQSPFSHGRAEAYSLYVRMQRPAALSAPRKLLFSSRDPALVPRPVRLAIVLQTDDYGGNRSISVGTRQPAFVKRMRDGPLEID
jgi:hypothetical protein